MAALLGAHIIKVKLPTDHIEQGEAKQVYEKHVDDRHAVGARRHVVQSSFAGRRIVVFSGGAAKGERRGLSRTRATFATAAAMARSSAATPSSAPRDDALAMLDRLVKIYLGKE